MGQTQTTKDTVWLKSLLNKIKKLISIFVALSIYFMQTVIINYDNKDAAMLIYNSLVYIKSKHIDIQRHYQ